VTSTSVSFFFREPQCLHPLIRKTIILCHWQQVFDFHGVEPVQHSSLFFPLVLLRLLIDNPLHFTLIFLFDIRSTFVPLA
jgi:hypothetical protein